MDLMRRFVHASNESEQSGSGYPGGVPGRCQINRLLRITRQSARLRQIKITAQQQASTTSNSGPRSTQRNETSNYEVDRTIRHTKMNVGDVQRSVRRGRGELQNLARWQTVASQQRTDETN
ncbi:hypothetical protein OIU92_01835 [Escherichia coli]|nr:hypothetical protein [Escherichia coli]